MEVLEDRDHRFALLMEENNQLEERLKDLTSEVDTIRQLAMVQD